MIKNCPFCGNKEHFMIDVQPNGSWFISCNDCACEVYGNTEEEAIKAWNTRVSPWIKCENGLPEKHGYKNKVNIYCKREYEKKKEKLTGYYENEKWFSDYCREDESLIVFAWMPISEFEEE